MAATKSKSAALRARLSHPVLDSDGHLVEYVPVLGEYLQKAGGNDAVKAFRNAFKTTYLSLDWYKLSPAERREQWARRPPFYVVPAKNTLDLATALFPKLLHERIDEIGFDYTVLYPSMGLHAPMFADPDIRRMSCRALNNYYADLFTEYGDRMTPVALIPMHTPQEAVEELDYAVGKRGLKVVMMPNYIKRPIAARGQFRRSRALRLPARHFRHRQRLRLRPGMGQMPGARRGAHFSQPRRGMGQPHLDFQLRVQPHRPFRLGG